jgi:hypothetical protein
LRNACKENYSNEKDTFHGFTLIIGCCKSTTNQLSSQ